ncbi:MAG: YceI family protein [Gammaproteobacteria bacterium]|nr:YceI family protein [Gammaproteobacteria bacterium]
MVKVAMADADGETEEYKIDIKGAHASVLFKVNHLGYSWLHGRFNDFNGAFTYDTGNPNNSKISVTIDTISEDSNHAERDKHLRSDDFLDVEKFPSASFESTSVSLVDGKGTVTGNLTLHGVTKAVVLNVSEVGTGEDPWGGYRRGFTGTTEFKMADFGITKNLGPASQTVYMELNIEGIRQ